VFPASQVKYSQQNLGPYRRCAVQIARSVLVGSAGDKILRVVDFFVRPVRERNAQAWELLGPNPPEFPRLVRGLGG
jgi:hypothetical protein